MGKSFKLLFFSGAINDKQIVIVPEGNIQICKDVWSICHLHKRKTFDDLKNLFANTTYMSKTRHAKCFKCMATWIRRNGICRNIAIISWWSQKNIISTFHLFCNKRSKAGIFYYFCGMGALYLQQRKQSYCRNRLSIYQCI